MWSKVAFGCYDSDLTIIANLLVDTGSSYTVLSKQFVRSIGCNLLEPLRQESIFTASGQITLPIVAVPWINGFGNRIENFPILACPLPPGTLLDGLLGMDFLYLCEAVIDIPQAKLFLA
jgi:predicted aspartyl protease